jgi:hypothetical protein
MSIRIWININEIYVKEQNKIVGSPKEYASKAPVYGD